MERLKRTAAIHDISGFGKCSLTVALPIISAMGIEVSVIPTAVLSTHTGGFTGFTYRDLTGDMRPIAKHWKSLGIKFDAIYSGFLGSVEQIDIVTDFIDDFKEKDTIVLVDPAMADGGKMYTVFDMDFAKQMTRLCAKADIITVYLVRRVLISADYNARLVLPEQEKILAFFAEKVFLSRQVEKRIVAVERQNKHKTHLRKSVALYDIISREENQ